MNVLIYVFKNIKEYYFIILFIIFFNIKNFSLYKK